MDADYSLNKPLPTLAGGVLATWGASRSEPTGRSTTSCRQSVGTSPGRTCPRAARPDDLVDRVEPLDGSRPERPYDHVAFGKAQAVGGDKNRARHGHLFHARREMRRLTDGRVVHAQVASDGADQHLARVHTD